MNRYSWPINALVAAVVAVGLLLALPNYFGTSPALEISLAEGADVSVEAVNGWQATLTAAGLAPTEARVDGGRGLLYYGSVDKQLAARTALNETLDNSTYTITYRQASNSPAWLRDLGLQPMSLGLDLRGGVYFLFEVDLEAAVQTRLEQYVQAFQETLSDAGIRRRVSLDGTIIRVRVQSPEALVEARPLIRRIDTDLDIADGPDGASLLVRMTEAQVAERETFAIDQNIITLRNRINELGVSEPLVQQQGRARIVVQLPGVQDPAEADRILNSTATLEYHAVDEQGNTPGARAYPTRDGRSVRIKSDVIASGDQIIDAQSTFSQGQPAVSVRLDAVGGKRMLEFTQENVGRRMAVLFITTDREEVVVDGERTFRSVKSHEIISDATIRGVFSTNFETTGLTPVEARDLALLLRAGALAAPIFKVEERTIGPTLGQENIDRGFSAVQIGFLAVIVFMIVYYRVFGVFASLALLTNLVLIVALLSLLQASLTLPGIAGIVLTVGMAVDANVLIFERIREELRDGSSVQVAINAGYEKAFSSIADANITTLIAALMLFAFGTGPIRGFAITLMLGIVTSMFTAIVGTRALVNALYGGRQLKDLPV
ncbi:MAG: protein translocase subunit SecD [Pseudomonadota bacterium]